MLKMSPLPTLGPIISPRCSQLQLSLWVYNFKMSVWPTVPLSFPISHSRIAYILHTVGFGTILSVFDETIFLTPSPFSCFLGNLNWNFGAAVSALKIIFLPISPWFGMVLYSIVCSIVSAHKNILEWGNTGKYRRNIPNTGKYRKKS